MSCEIRITSRSMEPEALRAELDSYLGVGRGDVSLKVVAATSTHRTGLEDPAVLVAVISSIGAAVGTVLNGIFSVLSARGARSEKIVVRGKDGASVEFPADLEQDQIPRLVELVHELDGPTFELP